MSDGAPLEAQRLTPEEEEKLRGEPLRTVRARNAEPVPATEVARARVRGFMMGAAVAAGAGVAAAVGYLFIRGARTPRKRRRKHV